MTNGASPSGSLAQVLPALFLALLFSLAPGIAEQRDNAPHRHGSFASLVAGLSERPGYFDTDNLISNERSYLHVVPELQALAGRGRGVYLGVGPDQNFSYIAHLRPSLAIVIDLRRDNLLLHLLFKALFAEARTRIAYLAMLTGRSPPEEGGKQRSVEEIVGYIDRAPPLRDGDLRALHGRLTTLVHSFGVPLTDGDRATIDRFHRRFIAEGLSLQFNTFGRPPQVPLSDFPRAAAGGRPAGRAAQLSRVRGRFPVREAAARRGPDRANRRRSERNGGARGSPRASCRGRTCTSLRSTPRTWSSTCSATAGSPSSSPISAGCRANLAR